MQDADRPAHVQMLPQPTRHRGPRMQMEPLSIVPRPENLHRIAAHLRSRRDVGQMPAVRAAEPKLAVRLSVELVALLVNGAAMPATLCRAPDYAECRRHRRREAVNCGRHNQRAWRKASRVSLGR